MKAMSVQDGDIWIHKVTGVIYEVEHVNDENVWLTEESKKLERPILIEELIANYSQIGVDDYIAQGGGIL